MSYISAKDGRRKALREGDTALIAGELNYQIFYFVKHSRNAGKINREGIIQHFVTQFIGKKPNYQKWNDLTGCLFCCSKEIKRRIQPIDEQALKIIAEILASYDKRIAIYEDEKIISNGDV